MTPSELLDFAHAVESAAGRERLERWGPRTLDVDVIVYDGLVSADPSLTLPHPRAHERAFVLVPLAEVVPGWVHPRLHRTVESLIAALPQQQIAPL